jgi:hypothetical protein
LAARRGASKDIHTLYFQTPRVFGKDERTTSLKSCEVLPGMSVQDRPGWFTLNFCYIPGMFLLTAAVLLLASEKEIAMGRAMNAELRNHTPGIDDEQIVAYASRIVDRFRERSPVPLTVEITSIRESARVSALPGGFLRIPIGAILRAESEADFARVVAHAVAHLAKRHHVASHDTSISTIPVVFLDLFRHGDPDLMPSPSALPRYREAEAEAEALASQWTRDYEATGEFEAIRQRALQLTAPPARRKPTLYRQ